MGKQASDAVEQLSKQASEAADNLSQQAAETLQSASSAADQATAGVRQSFTEVCSLPLCLSLLPSDLQLDLDHQSEFTDLAQVAQYHAVRTWA